VVDSCVVVVAKIFPFDDTDHTLGVVDLDALVGQLIAKLVIGDVHVARKEAPRGYPVVWLHGSVRIHLGPQQVELV